MPTVELPKAVRTIFLSDLHLGYWVSQGHLALEVLNEIAAEEIYLVGDIVDESRMAQNWYWPESHQILVDKFTTLGESIAVRSNPGNHDTFLRRENPLSDLDVDSPLHRIIKTMLEIVHAESFDYVTSSKQRLLVTHGDLYDDVDESLGGIPTLGSRIFDRLNWLLPRDIVNGLRWFFKLILAKPKLIQSRLIEDAKHKGYDGVIFGHLHEPKLFEDDGFVVGNCGDWMVNRSFIVEGLEGSLELYNFGKRVATV